MGPVEHHSRSRQAIDVGCVEWRIRVVNFEVQWRLIIDHDHQKVGAFVGVDCRSKREGEQRDGRKPSGDGAEGTHGDLFGDEAEGQFGR